MAGKRTLLVIALVFSLIQGGAELWAADPEDQTEENAQPMDDTTRALREAPKPDRKISRRRWCQLSLRTLILGTGAIAGGLGLWRREAEHIASIRRGRDLSVSLDKRSVPLTLRERTDLARYLVDDHNPDSHFYVLSGLDRHYPELEIAAQIPIGSLSDFSDFYSLYEDGFTLNPTPYDDRYRPWVRYRREKIVRIYAAYFEILQRDLAAREKTGGGADRQPIPSELSFALSSLGTSEQAREILKYGRRQTARTTGPDFADVGGAAVLQEFETNPRGAALIAEYFNKYPRYSSAADFGDGFGKPQFKLDGQGRPMVIHRLSWFWGRPSHIDGLYGSEPPPLWREFRLGRGWEIHERAVGPLLADALRDFIVERHRRSPFLTKNDESPEAMEQLRQDAKEFADYLKSEEWKKKKAP